MYHSIIIEESLKNPDVLKKYKILRTKFSAEENWHLHIVEIPDIKKAIAEVQEAMVNDAQYYFHIYNEGKALVIVFKNKIFRLDPNNDLTWQEAKEYGAKKLGIPIGELDFCPNKISEEDSWYNR